MYRDCVRLDDQDKVIGHCTWQEIMDGVRHRVVWGMVYHPTAKRWALQWRRPDKGICPLMWDMSAAGHVDWLDGEAESYRHAYARELYEELGLSTVYVDSDTSGTATPPAGIDSITYDLGAEAQEIVCPVAGGIERLLREVPGRFLTVYDGALTLPPDEEPLGLAWMSTQEIQDIIIGAELATVGLRHMLPLCDKTVHKMALDDAH